DSEMNDDDIHNDSRPAARGPSWKTKSAGLERFLEQPVHTESCAGARTRTAIHATWSGTLEECGHKRRSHREVSTGRPVAGVHCADAVSGCTGPEDDCVSVRVPDDLPHDLSRRQAASARDHGVSRVYGEFRRPL